MNGRIPHWILIVGIVTAANGCDNVSWGGMSIRLEGPPGDTLVPSSEDTGAGGEDGPLRIEYGPLLYAGTRQGDSALVVPVAELVDGKLRALPQGDSALLMVDQIREERLAPGQKLNLFHQGTRIGTLLLSSSSGAGTDYCPPRALALGQLELIPSAAEAERFLALDEALGAHGSPGPLRTSIVDRAQWNAAHNLAGEALNQLRAQWPGALQDIRQDIQSLPLSNDGGPAVVASFLFQDQLGIGPASDASYALFILGEPRGTRLDRTFTWYRRVGEDGKGAPRFFSSMDWDGDGDEEILLEVFGADARWWAALDRENGAWSIAFQDPCGTLEGQDAPGPQAPDGPR
jgi:hypothetical protein